MHEPQHLICMDLKPCKPPHRVIDPCILGWLAEPQLMNREEKEVDVYSLETLGPRYGLAPLAAAVLDAAPTPNSGTSMGGAA